MPHARVCRTVRPLRSRRTQRSGARAHPAAERRTCASASEEAKSVRGQAGSGPRLQPCTPGPTTRPRSDRARALLGATARVRDKRALRARDARGGGPTEHRRTRLPRRTCGGNVLCGPRQQCQGGRAATGRRCPLQNRPGRGIRCGPRDLRAAMVPDVAGRAPGSMLRRWAPRQRRRQRQSALTQQQLYSTCCLARGITAPSAPRRDRRFRGVSRQRRTAVMGTTVHPPCRFCCIGHHAGAALPNRSYRVAKIVQLRMRSNSHVEAELTLSPQLCKLSAISPCQGRL